MNKRSYIIPEEVSRDEYFAQEWTKMHAGEVYDAIYPGFGELLRKTRRTIKRYNDLDSFSPELKEILTSLLGGCGSSILINQPFRCDFGCNIFVGENFFANFNLTILDEGLVTIGDNCFIGPNVSIYTACHPLEAEERNKGVEWAEPVTIGDNVWLGGNVTILPGVTIGDNCVIGAGSVVTKDIPDGCVAAGNPANVKKEIKQ